jgi:hypothetical protein
VNVANFAPSMAERSPRPEIRGATYRQVDYWARAGYLRLGRERDGTGSGYWRIWPDEEVRVARLMARLTGAGFSPAVAHKVARGESQVAAGVYVLVDLLGEEPDAALPDSDGRSAAGSVPPD